MSGRDERKRCAGIHQKIAGAIYTDVSNNPATPMLSSCIRVGILSSHLVPHDRQRCTLARIGKITVTQRYDANSRKS
jgi:hypothetical protein